jgi:Ala-tRNA(Pro) deacylase
MDTASPPSSADAAPPPGEAPDTYAALIALLDRAGARYRVIEHPPEGRTEIVSEMRGNPLAAAAKCIILIVKLGKKTTRFLLAVVPGDRRVDTGRIRALYRATYVGFAATDVAERLAGSVAGTVLPFAFSEELELVVDPSLLAHETLYFNAARLDRSLALASADYAAIAKPRLEEIAGD